MATVLKGDSLVKKILFIESPASLSQLTSDFYPSCVSAISILNDHSKISRTNYVFKQINGFVESPEISIYLPKFLVNSELSYIRSFKNIPLIGEIRFDMADKDELRKIASKKALRTDFFDKIFRHKNPGRDIIRISDYYKVDKKHIKFILVENDYKDLDVVGKKLEKDIATEMQSFSDNNDYRGMILELFIIYRCRVVRKEFKNEVFIDYDFENYSFEIFNKALKKISTNFVNKRFFVYLCHLEAHLECLFPAGAKTKLA